MNNKPNLGNANLHPIMLEALAAFIPPYTPEQAAAIDADLRYNKDKNSGKLLKDKVDFFHRIEVNTRAKLNPLPIKEL